MADPLRARLESIGELSKQLNAETDDASRIVQRVESYLNTTLYYGMNTYIEMSEDGDADNGISDQTFLIYGRLGGKCRIYVRRLLVVDGNPDRDDEIPWDNCSRELKIAVLDHLPALLDEIQNKLTQTLANIKETKQALDAELPPAKGAKK
jgi:hypothetical protein